MALFALTSTRNGNCASGDVKELAGKEVSCCHCWILLKSAVMFD